MLNADPSRLKPREEEVLSLLAKGYASKEIAEIIGLT
jgi:DNA-binding CsgD family transcriptional regulator